MRTEIRAIEYHFPANIVSNQDLAAEFPDWAIDRIQAKTGIVQRHIAAPDECSSDLAVAAAQKLFAAGSCSPEEIDYILLCTQSPDYWLPTTACLLQERLGIPTSAGALDFNQGCSGYVYGLGIAQGLIETAQASSILFLTAETYSKFIHPQDRSVRALFGDAASATLLQAAPDNGTARRSACVFGTDGRGAAHLMVPAGASRQPSTNETGQAVPDSYGNWRSQNNLFMNGAEVFNFSLEAVPKCVAQLLERAGKQVEDVDLFVFHQANQYMLENLRRKVCIPEEKFYLWLSQCGNTVSSSIPIALKHALEEGRLQNGLVVMLVGFGVGFSWGATLLEWPNLGLHELNVEHAH